MDPKLLWDMVQRARADGVPEEEIERGIRIESRGTFRSLADLQQAAGVAPAPAASEAPGTEPRFTMSNAVDMLKQGGFFGFGDEADGAMAVINRGAQKVGLLRGEGMDLPPAVRAAAEASGHRPETRSYAEARDDTRARVAQARDDHKGASFAAEMAGGLLPVGGAINAIGGNAFRLASRGQSLKGLLGTGRTLQQMGAASETARLAATAAAPGMNYRLGSSLGRTLAGIGKGAAIGGGAAGTYAAGSAEGNLVERLQDAAPAAAGGAVLGGGLAGATALAGGVLGHFLTRGHRTATRNARIGNQLEQMVPDASPRNVRGASEARRAMISQGYQQVEDLPLGDPRIQRFFTADNDVGDAIRAGLRRTERDGRIGKLGSDGLEIRDYQTARRAIQDKINVARRSGEGSLMQDLIAKKNELDSLVDAVVTSDILPLNRAWRVEMEIPDALSAGRAAAGKSASELRDAMAEFADPETLQAFRAGLARRLVDTVSDREGPIRMTNSLREQILAAVDGDALKADAFEGALRIENRAQRVEQLESILAGIAGFWFGGTSLFGRLTDG